MSERSAAQLGPSARQVGAVLGTLVLLALVVPFVVFAVPQVIGADHGFVILSGSMEPDIAPGDVVIVDASASVGVGDIVTFEEDGDVPVTHRIVAEENGQWVTKGDANENRDARPVPPENVLGKVVLTIPLIGHVVLWANTPVGYSSLVLVPLVLLLGNELLSWARARDETDDGGDEGDGSDPEPTVAAESAADGERAVNDGAAEENTMTQTAGEERDRRSGATATAGESSGSASVTVAVADLKLSVLASLALTVYAALNVSAEVQLFDAPDPISVGALTAGLLGLLFTSWVTGHAWYSARSARKATAEPDAGRADWPMPETDGGVASESSDNSSERRSDGGTDDGVANAVEDAGDRPEGER
ncbi:signal peptidase I [Halorientalis pallida]|uniref:Signal peptidase I n=1 Tax=Halorientalis pallida TaxID=2479928 RepID=A0A498L0M0_9EURY|nr:signal peptidase I [Halorientalis pallida]RXK50383.1 signal peptidase I [Halorientalis pallida]